MGQQAAIRTINGNTLPLYSFYNNIMCFRVDVNIIRKNGIYAHDFRENSRYGTVARNMLGVRISRTAVTPTLKLISLITRCLNDNGRITSNDIALLRNDKGITLLRVR